MHNVYSHTYSCTQTRQNVHENIYPRHRHTYSQTHKHAKRQRRHKQSHISRTHVHMHSLTIHTHLCEWCYVNSASVWAMRRQCVTCSLLLLSSSNNKTNGFARTLKMRVWDMCVVSVSLYVSESWVYACVCGVFVLFLLVFVCVVCTRCLFSLSLCLCVMSLYVSCVCVKTLCWYIL